MTYQDDPTLLKIKGDNGHYLKLEDGSSRKPETTEETDEARKQYIKKLSSAILTVVAKHGSARLKAVGAPSISNALKSAIIARGEGSKKGLDLVLEPSFDNATFEGNVKTAIVLRVVAR
jgi:stage V sporulation protein SpoVS